MQMKERFSALNFHILSSLLAAQSFIVLVIFCSLAQSQEIAAPQNFHQWGASPADFARAAFH
jgi:hypothetical protein